MELQLAKGVNDTSSEDKILELRIVDKLRKVFELYGYNPLDTPILERCDVLAAKYAGGSEILKEMFTLEDQGKRKLALRYDLTVPFARYVGMNKNLKLPFKRYQIGRVFRDGPIKVGRYREFWQCDIDVVGVSSIKIDAEFVDIFNTVFKDLNLDIEIRVNNRKILDSIMNKFKVKNPDEVVLVIDKLEKLGLEEIKKELKERKLNNEQVSGILKLINVRGSNKEKIKFLKNELGECKGLNEVEEIMEYNNEFVFDVSLARGLAYYTGTIYEVFLKNGRIKSSLAGGGRYDNMIGEFLGAKDKYPAIGVSFGLSVICDALNQEKIKTKTMIYVVPIGVDCSRIVKELRDFGINTDLDYSNKGVTKNLRYASSLGIPFVLFAGEKELKSEKYTLRDMTTGKEYSIGLDKLRDFFKDKTV